MKKIFHTLLLSLISLTCINLHNVIADLVLNFDDLSLPSESFYNGSDNAGGFSSNGVSFNNTFTDFGGGFSSWSGFSYSNRTRNDATSSELSTQSYFSAQYDSFAGGGSELNGNTVSGNNFAVAFNFSQGDSTIDLPNGFSSPQSIQITNSTYTGLSMTNGDAFAKKFGGVSSDDADFLKLTIFGKDNSNNISGSVDAYLADFRSSNNSEDFILAEWLSVDLTPLGSNVSKLEFLLTSTDNGSFGINTPTYFALDNLVLVPEAAAVSKIFGIVALVWSFIKRRNF